ncbi:Afg1l [Symbiodinium sp. CCMP2592]|nr:Afg1l [Symbiodinium sp. CCMP2592]
MRRKISALCLSLRRTSSAAVGGDALRAAFEKQVVSGRLTADPVQRSVVDFLGDALTSAAGKRPNQETEAQEPPTEGGPFPNHPRWVLPRSVAGPSGAAATAEDHRQVAEWSRRVAAENARRMRGQRGAETAGSFKPSEARPTQVPSSTMPGHTPTKVEHPAPTPQVRKPQKTSVYMHGPVGTGKTMLMDLFYEHARKAGLRTMRRHFYEFMMGLHRQIHQIQEDRPVEVAANSLADDIDVLCFDEFQITDIQDAAILPRLFEVLFLRGVTVVMTSNTSPQLLYSGGLNRHVHLPSFISVLGDYCLVLGLGAGGKAVDYRRQAEAAEQAEGASGTFGYLFGDDAENRLFAQWEQLADDPKSTTSEAKNETRDFLLTLPMGRTLKVRAASGKACLVHFEDLCAADRGEADFAALAERFRTVLLAGVPRKPPISERDLYSWRSWYKFIAMVRSLPVLAPGCVHQYAAKVRQILQHTVGVDRIVDLGWPAFNDEVLQLKAVLEETRLRLHHEERVNQELKAQIKEEQRRGHMRQRELREQLELQHEEIQRLLSELETAKAAASGENKAELHELGQKSDAESHSREAKARASETELLAALLEHATKQATACAAKVAEESTVVQQLREELEAARGKASEEQEAAQALRQELQQEKAARVEMEGFLIHRRACEADVANFLRLLGQRYPELAGLSVANSLVEYLRACLFAALVGSLRKLQQHPLMLHFDFLRGLCQGADLVEDADCVQRYAMRSNVSMQLQAALDERPVQRRGEMRQRELREQLELQHEEIQRLLSELEMVKAASSGENKAELHELGQKSDAESHETHSREAKARASETELMAALLEHATKQATACAAKVTEESTVLQQLREELEAARDKASEEQEAAEGEGLRHQVQQENASRFEVKKLQQEKAIMRDFHQRKACEDEVADFLRLLRQG